MSLPGLKSLQMFIHLWDILMIIGLANYSLFTCVRALRTLPLFVYDGKAYIFFVFVHCGLYHYLVVLCFHLIMNSIFCSQFSVLWEFYFVL